MRACRSSPGFGGVQRTHEAVAKHPHNVMYRDAAPADVLLGQHRADRALIDTTPPQSSRIGGWSPMDTAPSDVGTLRTRHLRHYTCIGGIRVPHLLLLLHDQFYDIGCVMIVSVGRLAIFFTQFSKSVSGGTPRSKCAHTAHHILRAHVARSVLHESVFQVI